ncbi:VanZ family protein [Geosporobacter ferrireducens]|uniref:VanZ-like domain-containing protein n=1 Tax=Geosporobacter ferrireducens TaxID=1424294 RepID=A0A1D8GGK5_9FIRM|nr:VanZ family protein [Geosporobacter ferrireducens]AOT70050.1 hypothetical protein Gferi_10905 [Geosporobacter ferrireducens]MTI53402.1 hypothetical protein [Geosporobacter ferrireducens]
MRRKHLGIIFFLVFILWTVMIFYFSSQPPNISHSQSSMAVRILRKANEIFDITDSRIYQKGESLIKDVLLMGRYKTSNAVVRKSAHFGIYFVLGILCSSFGYIYSGKIFIGFLLGASLPVAIAVLDEFNQGFVGRISSLNDVIIDGVGAFIGTVIVICIIMIVKGISAVKAKSSK